MAELGQTLGVAGIQPISEPAVSAEPRPRIVRIVLPDLPPVEGWPTHTSEVVSDAQWEVLGPQLEALQNDPRGERVLRAGGTMRPGNF